MTPEARKPVFATISRTLVGGAVCAMLLPLGACGTASIDGAVPVSAAQTDGARTTGTFPNLNIAPKVAGPQITETEKAQTTTELTSAQARQTSKGAVGKNPSNQEDLRRIAQTHADAALKEIEGE